jgi:DNA-binding response OmpR family regulator
MSIGVKRILAIEDDADLGLLMRDYFAQHRIEVEAVHDGRTGCWPGRWKGRTI